MSPKLRVKTKVLSTNKIFRMVEIFNTAKILEWPKFIDVQNNFTKRMNFVNDQNWEFN